MPNGRRRVQSPMHMCDHGSICIYCFVCWGKTKPWICFAFFVVLCCDWFAVIIARPTFTVTNTVLVTLIHFQSVAKAIDMIIFHIENNIYLRRIISTACAPNHEESTWRKKNTKKYVRVCLLFRCTLTKCIASVRLE